MIYLICLIGGIALGGVLVYFGLKPQLKKQKQYNFEIEKQNEKLASERVHLATKKQQLENDVRYLTDLIKTMENLKREKVENEKVLIEAELSEYKKDFLSTLADYVSAFKQKDKEVRTECFELEQTLSALRSTVDAATEAAKREQEKQAKEFFYRVILSKEDLEEIQKLKSIIPYLRDSEPLNKIIWKIYYEKPTTDMVGRVVGKECRTGIYKLTNLTNQMCYVGQSVNIAERFKQHIKRGLGAETATNNKLYPAMKENGVENFSFEIIEDCEKNQLNEREKFWQDYFHAQDFGYSIK